MTVPWGYAIMVSLGFVAGGLVRRVEVARLGYQQHPGHRFVALGALLGAMVGSKLGMVLFAADMGALWQAAFSLDFTGKTVVGGIGGAWLGVELTKRLVGITESTGDGFAIAAPVAQAFGRVGCFFQGCCPGVRWDGPLSINGRVPQQLIETAALLGLAGVLWQIRRQPRPRGYLFRYYIGGYAVIRFVLEFVRGDNGPDWGLTPVQWVCALTALAMLLTTRASSEPQPARR